MSLSVRRLEPADAEVSRQLGWEAFGVPTTPPTEPASLDRPGMTWFGAFADAGEQVDGTPATLVARMADREYDSCFGGALVPTCGVAGVTVAAEYRGQGALTPLFAATLDFAHQRGATVSTLFPTAPGIYRRFGYELVAEFLTVALPTAALAAVAPPTDARARRATSLDVEAIREVYDRWAIEQNGPLSRRGPSFPDAAEDLLGDSTAVTVAVDGDDRVIGYASWDRGQGYGDSAALEVSDLLATSRDGYRALLRTLGSFATVAPTTRIDTSGDDLARLELPSLAWRVHETSPYMLRVIDVAGAITARRFPRSIAVSLGFAVAGDLFSTLDGGYELDVRDGRAECRRRSVDAGDRVLSPRGLALLYAGTQSSANLRASGHLSGGDPEQDPEWDALFGGRQRHIRDYF